MPTDTQARVLLNLHLGRSWFSGFREPPPERTEFSVWCCGWCCGWTLTGRALGVSAYLTVAGRDALVRWLLRGLR